MGLLAGWTYCPRCGGELVGGVGRVDCRRCGFVGYANPVPGAEVILRDHRGRVLLGRRAFDPAKGLWDLPGGFLDEEEHPLDALRREVREETSLELEALRFLGHYLEPYDGRTVLCLAWTGRGVGEPHPGDDLVELRWFSPDELPSPRELAFAHYAEVIAAALARDDGA